MSGNRINPNQPSGRPGGPSDKRDLDSVKGEDANPDDVQKMQDLKKQNQPKKTDDKKQGDDKNEKSDLPKGSGDLSSLSKAKKKKESSPEKELKGGKALTQEEAAKAAAQGKVTGKGEKTEKDKDQAKPNQPEVLSQAGKAGLGPLGQPVVQETQGAASSRTADLAQIASEMAKSMLVSDPNLGNGNEVRVTLQSKDPNLSGTQIIFSKTDGDLGAQLNIQFVTATQNASNFLSQNQQSLNTLLNNELSGFNNIQIDIAQQQSDTGGRDRGSRGEYISPEDQDNT